MKNMVVTGTFNRYSTYTEGGNWLHVEFIEVGGTRYKNVVWSKYMHTLMEEALGKEVRISIGKYAGAHAVAAIEYAGRVEKEPRKAIVCYSQLGTLAILLASFVIAGIIGVLLDSGAAFLLLGFGIFGCWAYLGTRNRYQELARALDTHSVPS